MCFCVRACVRVCVCLCVCVCVGVCMCLHIHMHTRHFVGECRREFSAPARSSGFLKYVTSIQRRIRSNVNEYDKTSTKTAVSTPTQPDAHGGRVPGRVPGSRYARGRTLLELHRWGSDCAASLYTVIYSHNLIYDVMCCSMICNTIINITFRAPRG